MAWWGKGGEHRLPTSPSRDLVWHTDTGEGMDWCLGLHYTCSPIVGGRGVYLWPLAQVVKRASKSGYSLYSAEMMSNADLPKGRDRLSEVARRWKALPEDQKNEFCRRAAEGIHARREEAAAVGMHRSRSGSRPFTDARA